MPVSYLSDLYPLTCPAWLILPGAKVPVSWTYWVTENPWMHKPYHRLDQQTRTVNWTLLRQGLWILKVN